jgi:hypothetical protein
VQRWMKSTMCRRMNRRLTTKSWWPTTQYENRYERKRIGGSDRWRHDRRDLAAINAAIRLFSVEVGAEHVASYMDVYRLFKRGEQIAICKAALASEGPLSTPELCSPPVSL